jgi:hypothetical protein
MSLYTSTYQFQSVQGPSDPMLTQNAVEGYQPVSRIGEVVINAFGNERPPFVSIFVASSAGLDDRCALRS